jgi:hypothetical protein
MLKTGDTFELTASDLVGHLNCRHLTDLDLESAEGKLDRPHFHDPLLQILAERGDRHEKNYLTYLASNGYEISLVEGAGVTRALVDRTLERMRAGVQIIAQGALMHGRWGGRTDILMRV